MDAIRDYIIAVAMRTHTGMDFLYSIPLDELMAIITSLAKSAKAQKQRVQKHRKGDRHVWKI